MQGGTMRPRRIFATDVAASVFFFAPAQALIPLAAFVAASRFEAPPVLVGAMITGAYFGYIWNLFFSGATARLELKQSLVAVMLVAPLFLVGAGLQVAAVPFCLLVLGYLLCFGVGGVQYNATIKHLYGEDERVRRLSLRFAAISATAAVLSVVYGRISVSRHPVVFFASAAASLCAAAVFSRIRTGVEARMQRFRPRQVFDVFRINPAMRLVGIGLGIYGIVGSALHIPTTYLYTSLGYAEDTVGILTAVRVVATVAAALLVTPRLKHPGGFANFRPAFLAASVAIVCFLVGGIVATPDGALVLLVAANACFGLSISGFEVALQTTAIGLAPRGFTSLYVNALMIVFGIRGLLWPVAVGSAMQLTGHLVMLGLCLASAIGCVLLTFSPAGRSTVRA